MSFKVVGLIRAFKVPNIAVGTGTGCRQVYVTRGLSTSVIRLNDIKSTEVEPLVNKPKTKKFSFTKFIFKYGFLAAVVYGGVLYVATKNDTVMDFVIDQQLPYYEPIIDLIEHGTIEDLQHRIEDYVDNIKNFSLSSQFSRGEQIFKDTKTKLGNVASGTKIPKEVHDATPAQQLQKPVETVQAPKIKLPLIQLDNSSVDESVKNIIGSFNEFIESIEVSAANGRANTLINEVNNKVHQLSTKLNSLSSQFDETLQAKIKESQTDLLTNMTKKELELSESFLDQFNQEKLALENKLNNRLYKEVEATREAINQAAANAISMVRIEQTKQFEQLIKTKIDNERNGRLAHLQQLEERLTEVEEFSVGLETQLVANHNKGLLVKLILNLKHVLSSNLNGNEKPKELATYFDKIEQCAKSINDELINVAIGDLKPLIAHPSADGILSNSQLVSKWQEISPELRSASLLPPNAGLLGHLSSLLFSKLLLPVNGSKPNGKDIESVIGRIDASLARGDLDIAVEEAANLKGWPRKLANDWIKHGRQRLEVEFLLDVVDSEAQIV